MAANNTNGTLTPETWDKFCLESSAGIYFPESLIHVVPVFHSLLFSYWKFVVIAILASLIFYYFCWKPLYIFKDFTDFGFYEAQNQPGASDATRRRMINELRKRRKLGEVLPPIYANGWFAVLESEDLPKNKVKEISCLGLNLVGWRGESGKAYVTDAYCPHLGAHLGVYGEVKGECIKCPFHGWSFEGKNGKCVDVPYSETVPDFAKIKVWTTVEVNRTIYLWYHAEGDEPTYYPDEFPQIASGEWKFRGKSEYKVLCHPQDISENGADLSHLSVLHKPSITEGGKPMEARVKWSFLKHTWAGSWEPNSDPKLGHRALMTVDHKMTLFDRFHFLHAVVKAHQVGPGTVFLRYDGFGGDGVLLFHFTPLEPMMVKITQKFYTSRSMLHPLSTLVLYIQSVQVERDISVWNRKTFINKPILTKEDKTIVAFRRWFAQFYSENSPRLQFQRESSSPMDIEF